MGGERVERKEGRTSEPEARFRTASSLSSCSVTVVPSFLLFLLFLLFPFFFLLFPHARIIIRRRDSFFPLIFNPLRSNDDSETPLGSMPQLEQR